MKISFVIPSYNQMVFLPHAVISCLEQTHKDIEVVVIDDGSIDMTGEYLDWLKDNPRVKIIRNEKNLGRVTSRNLGNAMATGDVICVLDSDDLATPNRAELVVRKMGKSKLDYVYGGATVIDCLGRPEQVLGADVFDLEKSLKEPYYNYIVHSTVAYTKEFAKKYPYREEMSSLGLEDWAQQIEAKMGGARFDFIPQRLCAYRQLRSQTVASRNEAEVKTAKLKFLESLKVPC